ncbi:endonuclease domain-containing protein [Novosphingobium kaempferiae]|uniref:endonuclease domain-containing protein n=1 Tax=Novosphingobium kaempferiae TaxID=2896849 RepID=UPI001E2AA32B|nr:endonuclease domain-containing protein [Novosphingobium kaempferiae]
MKRALPPLAVKRARELRLNATDAERAMWRLLRRHFPRAHFRRQVPLLHYIADFASHSLKIVIEIDGGQHSPETDAARTHAIESQGYRVIRFWNTDLLSNPEGCMIALDAALAPAS